MLAEQLPETCSTLHVWLVQTVQGPGRHYCPCLDTLNSFTATCKLITADTTTVFKAAESSVETLSSVISMEITSRRRKCGADLQEGALCIKRFAVPVAGHVENEADACRMEAGHLLTSCLATHALCMTGSDMPKASPLQTVEGSTS